MIYKKIIPVVTLVSIGSVSLGLLGAHITPSALAVTYIAAARESTSTTTAEVITGVSPEGITAPAESASTSYAAMISTKTGQATEPLGITDATIKDNVFSVPFYSQFTDITSPSWQKIGCGITSLAMLIDFYVSDAPTVDTLLQEGISADAYLDNVGWTYAGLITVSEKYGLTGQSYDLGSSDMETAFRQLQNALNDGPVMVSVHYTFDPKNPIPHLVVANSVRDGMLYYNDPAEKSGGGSISVSQFQSAWKKRYIVFRLL